MGMKLFKINPIKIIKISGFTAKILSIWYIINILLTLLYVFSPESLAAISSKNGVYIANIATTTFVNILYAITFFGYSKLIQVFTSVKEEKNEKGS